jgi:hypothetical protein
MTLAWSYRGFPLGAARFLEILRRGGARLAVVFHDVAAIENIVGGASFGNSMLFRNWRFSRFPST